MLDPKVLASIADLELVARRIVDGTVSGLHRSPFHGYSAEFSQYRHYRPGDDLKYVDWKLFARTDRVFTKQYRETTNLAAGLVIDASASMGFCGGNGVSKFNYARLLAAALGHLVASQGDAIGLVVYDDRLLTHVGARLGQSHLRKVLAALSAARARGGGRSEASGVRRAVDLLRARGLLLLFSDAYEEESLDGEIRRAIRIGHEVALFHVLTREEVDFPYRGDLELEDAETGRTLLTNAGRIAAGYRAAMSAFLERWRSRAASYGFAYTPALTDMPPDQLLRQYLLKQSTASRRQS
ncbi:MAG: DUF58 domain-containing protein [Vicinamibacterales bacterium]